MTDAKNLKVIIPEDVMEFWIQTVSGMWAYMVLLQSYAV